MTTAAYHHPSRREALNELFDRLTRVQAATGTIRSLAAGDASATMLADALLALEQDLTLAGREASAARARIRR